MKYRHKMKLQEATKVKNQKRRVADCSERPNYTDEEVAKLLDYDYGFLLDIIYYKLEQMQTFFMSKHVHTGGAKQHAKQMGVDLSDRELLNVAYIYSEICNSEIASGKSVCYAKHYAEVSLCREYVDGYCRLFAEACDYAVKQGAKDDHLLFAFASDCAEAYVNEHIAELPRLKSIYNADWQQDFLTSLQDRMMKELEVEEDNAGEHNIPSPRKTRTNEIMDMMFPEGIDDGYSLPED